MVYVQGNKSGDMDYQEYMNIINKVRKSKELERVRTEQLRLASMYAREKKRQEELKKEEERLKRERIKIEQENHTQAANKLASFPKQQSASSSLTVNRPNNEHRSSSSSTSTNNSSSTSLARSNEVEKGQLDYKEAEMKKNSPQRSINENLAKVAPVEAVKSFQPQNVIPNFQPKHFGPGQVSADVSKTYHPIDKPLTIQATNNFSAANKLSNDVKNTAPILSVVDGRADREEQLRLEQMWLEQRQQQVKVEQENLERLREEQLRQEKEREEIRRLEIERLRQIQEEQRRLEEERRRQEERMRLEQMRLEEERKRQEKLQAEKNAEYNRQRLDIEAKNIAALQEEHRAARERSRQLSEQRQPNPYHQQHHVSFGNSTEIFFTPQEKMTQDKSGKQDKLREEHKREEAKIRQEKLNLINQEEMLIKRQEDMLLQIESERQNLAKQEMLIRKRQQERLMQVRQEKLLLEKQEETLLMREQQLLQEKVRQEKLREEQKILREQEEAIRKRQEEISKELMEEITVSDDITVCPALEGQVFRGPIKSILLPPSSDFQNQLSPRADHNTDSKASTSPPPLQYIPQMTAMGGSEADLEQVDEEMEGSYYSGSESDEDTIDEDGYYESKVEVKQNSTSVPTSVRTIETKIDNPPWAPITPYLCYPEKQTPSHGQEEITAIFSQCKTSHYIKDGVITSPESMRTSTNLITTPESCISLHSQISQTEPRSRQSSFSPPPIPPLPTDEVQGQMLQNILL